MPSVALTLEDATALALVLRAAESTAPADVATAAEDALDLLQAATASTAGERFISLV